MVEKEALREKLAQWEGTVSASSLPAWDAFPALPLYMDQVIFLLNQYLALLPGQAAEKQVTPAMINNYVKLKIIPPPVKKRYGRAHLAYLVIVCLCKQTMNTADIKKLIPLGLAEEDVRAVYEGFVSMFHDAQRSFCQEARKAAEPLLSGEDQSVTRFVFRTVTLANLAKLLAEEILCLDGGEDDPSAC